MSGKEKIKDAVDFIVAATIKKGRLEQDTGAVLKHELFLPYCTITSLTIKQRGFEPVVEIAEHFGSESIDLRNTMLTYADGFRLSYLGGRGGLSEVYAQGIHYPGRDGKILAPGEMLLRSKEFADESNLTLDDHFNFVNWLAYAQRELQD